MPCCCPCRYSPSIIQHCLHVYGCSPAQGGTGDAQLQAEARTATTSNRSSSSSSYVLDERQVCLHYARKLLHQRTLWPLHAFLPAWQQEVPGGCWSPTEDMLAGEALVLQPDASEGARDLGRVRPWQQHALCCAPCCMCRFCRSTHAVMADCHSMD